MSASRYITLESRNLPRYQSRSSLLMGGLVPRKFADLAEAIPIDKTSPDYLQHLHWRLTHFPRDKGAHLWIDIDFNLPDINWDQETVLAYANSASVSNLLFTLVKDVYLDQK